MPEERTATSSCAGSVSEVEQLRALVAKHAAIIKQLRERIQELEARPAAPVANADETGMRVAGALHWLHVLSTARLTAYFAHPKRGVEALEAFGLLAQFLGILVHDWSAYARYRCLHASCNAHPLRELIAIAESIPSQTWAGEMITLLCEANALAGEARAQGLTALPTAEVERLQRRYDTILAAAKARNPRRARRHGTRGRVKQSPAYNLVFRLRAHRDAVLRFITDLRVPFDNNRAERDIRMPKPASTRSPSSAPTSRRCASNPPISSILWSGHSKLRHPCRDWGS